MTGSEFFAQLVLELIKLHGNKKPIEEILKEATKIYNMWKIV